VVRWHDPSEDRDEHPLVRLRDRIVKSGAIIPRRRAPMTAVIAGSEPLATLLCNSAERSIVNGLRETARRCSDSGLHVRMYVFDDPADQREALLTPVRVIIWDGHSSWDDDVPGVDGSSLEGVFGDDGRSITAEALIIGCCWGADSQFTDVLRGCLAVPTAYVGCQKQPGKTHGAIVFPPLLEALASLEPGADLDTRVAALREALDQTAADRPAIKPAQWTADRLSPLATRWDVRPR
jgi:hypothetical protein